MKRVPNAMLLKSSISWCSAWQRSSRCSLPLRISMALIPLLSLTGCSGGVLDPQGPIGAANLQDPAQRAGDHAGDRGADDRRDAGLRLVVSRLNTRATISARLGLFRQDRTGGLVDPAPRHHVSRRRDLDRLARARSVQADRVAEPSRSRSRSSRSIGNGCSSTPSRASRASTSSSSPPACRCISRSPRRA